MKTSSLAASVRASAPAPSCVLECLEPRLAPAGVVAVTLNGSTLTLVGDEGSNQVVITQSGGNWLIRSVEDTDTTFSLNGADAGSELRVAPKANIKATMNGGDDRLSLSFLTVAGTVTVLGNDGNDHVSISESVILGAVKVDTGAGGDFVSLSNANLAKPLNVKMGAGDDLFTLGNSTVGSVVVDMGTGSDAVSVSGFTTSVLGALTVKGAGGEGTVSSFSIGDVNGISGKVSYSLAAGNAAVSLGDGGVNLAAGMSVRTGAGNDIVSISGEVAIHGLLDLNLGAGDNSVTAADAEELLLGSFKYTGGSGNDLVAMDAGATMIGGSVTASLGAGDDNQLSFKGASLDILGKLTYKGGTGGDSLFVDHSYTKINGAVSFSGGNGINSVDFVSSNAKLASSVTIKGGVDSDVFNMNDTTVAGKVSVNMGNGPTSVGLTGSEVYGSLTVAFGGSAGQFAVIGITNSYVGGAVTMKATGNADNSFSVNHSTLAGKFSLSSGGGNDTVNLDVFASTALNRFGGAVKIVLGAGDDAFYAGQIPVTANVGNTFESSLSVDGGQGTDLAFFLTGFNNSFDTEPVVKGFETAL